MKTKLACTFLLAAAAFAIAAETVTVKSAKVTVREGPTNYDLMVTTVSNGTSLNVLETKGNFLKVAVNGKEGWVRKSDLEARAAGPNGLSVAGAALSGSGNAGEVQDANASKGLLGESDQYARSSGVDPAKVDALKQRSQKIINSGELVKFDKDGHVGGK